MERTEVETGSASASGRFAARRFWVLFGVLALAVIAPVSAVTISKVNVSNTFAQSNYHRVVVYGLSPLRGTSLASLYTRNAYNTFTAAPYPYATSTNTRANFGFSIPTTYVLTNERA